MCKAFLYGGNPQKIPLYSRRVRAAPPRRPKRAGDRSRFSRGGMSAKREGVACADPLQHSTTVWIAPLASVSSRVQSGADSDSGSRWILPRHRLSLRPSEDDTGTRRACMPGAFLCRPRRVLATACVAGESSGSLSPSRHPIGPGSRPRPTVQSTLWWNVAAGRRTRHLRASHSSHLERTGIDPQPAWGVVEALPSLCESTVGFFVGFRHRGKPYTRKTQKPEPRTQKLISL